MLEWCGIQQQALYKQQLNHLYVLYAIYTYVKGSVWNVKLHVHSIHIWAYMHICMRTCLYLQVCACMRAVYCSTVCVETLFILWVFVYEATFRVAVCLPC